MDATTAWLDAAGSIALLTKDEQITLGRQIQGWQAGTVDEKTGRRALNKMISANLRLVVKVWKSNFSFIEAKDPRVADLLQEGALGIRHAALKFDPARGFTFATYSIAWIRRYMGVYLRDKDRMIRLSADCYAIVNTVNKFSDQYEAIHGKKPSMTEVAAHCKKPEHSVRRFMRSYGICNTRTSLDQPLTARNTGAELDATYGESIPAPAPYSLEADTRAEKISRILNILFEAAGFNDDDRMVVSERLLYSDEPLSFAQLGEQLGMRASAVRPYFHRCMKRLEQAATSSGMSVTGILCRA